MLSIFQSLTSRKFKTESKILLKGLLATYNLEAPQELGNYLVKSAKEL